MTDRAQRSPTHYAIGKKNPNLPFHPAVRAGSTDVAVAQLQGDGSLDLLFDGDGKVISDFVGSANDSLSSRPIVPKVSTRSSHRVSRLASSEVAI